MFLLWSILIIIILISFYKFYDKYLIKFITKKFNSSPCEVNALYEKADSVAEESNKNITKELEDIKEKKKTIQKIMSKKFKK